MRIELIAIKSNNQVKVNFVRNLLIAAISIILLTNPFILFAAEGDILFFDDFNDGNLDGWIVESGNWYISNGVLIGSQSGRSFGGRINTNNSEWDNYRLELDVNAFQGIDQGVGVRYTQSGSYEVNLRYGTGAYDTPQVKLWKKNGSDYILLEDTNSLPLINDKWYHLTIDAFNENIKVWIDDTLIFDFTDTGTNVKKGVVDLEYSTGAVGIANMGFDNVKVTTLSSPPLSKTPLILIPGIGGSEFKSDQDFTSEIKECGTLPAFIYKTNDIVWVNTIIAGISPCDDYFDILKLKSDGQTPDYPQIVLNGTIYQEAYGDLINFLEENDYELNKTLFIFPYDWRKDINLTSLLLDQKVEQIKQQTGSTKVDIIAHSMGGLVAKNYIREAEKAGKIRKLITLGAPYLGSVKLLKALRYGDYFGEVYLLGLLSLNPNEIKEVVQNFTGAFELLPSKSYYEFYDNHDSEHPAPFRDDYDIDQNGVTGTLNFDQLRQLLTNFGHNMSLFSIADSFHNQMDKIWQNGTNNVETTLVVGSGEPTLIQIHEQNKIKLNFAIDTGLKINKREEILVNGDGTVPLHSASLIDESRNLNFAGSIKRHYVKQEHGSLTSRNSGSALSLVKNILENKTDIPVGVQDTPYQLKGNAVIVQSPVELHIYDASGNHTGPTVNGNFETNIPGSTYSTLESTKSIWLPDNGHYTIKLIATDAGEFDLKMRSFENNLNSQTILYKNIPLKDETKAEAEFDTNSTQSPVLQIDQDGNGTIDSSLNPTYVLTGNQNYDQTPPQTEIHLSGVEGLNGWYKSDVTVTLNASDELSGSGILKTEYALDGQTINTYTGPFTVSAEGVTNLKVRSVDNAGNEENPKEIEIKIDKTAPEVKVSVDPDKLDLVVEEIDTNQTTVERSDNTETKKKDDTIYIITDIAGNITTLDVRERDKEKKDRFRIHSIKYNEENPIDLPNNYFNVSYNGKKEKLNINEQNFELKSEIKIRIKYDQKKNKSTIIAKESKEEKVKEVRDGLILLHLLTNKGQLETTY